MPDELDDLMLKIACLARCLLLSVFCTSCIICHYVENDDVPLVDHCLFYFIVGLLELVCCISFDVICRYSLFPIRSLLVNLCCDVVNILLNNRRSDAS